MQGQRSNKDTDELGDDIPPIRNLGDLFVEDLPLVFPEKQPVHGSSSLSLSSPTVSAVVSTQGSSPSARSTSVLNPISSTMTPENYVYGVIRRMEDFLDFPNGPKCAIRTRHDVTPFKDGVAAIEVPWFSFLCDGAAKALTAAELLLETPPMERHGVLDGVFEMDVRTTRSLFTQSLGGLTGRVVQCFFFQLVSYRRRVPPELQELVDRISSRFIQDSLRKQECSSPTLVNVSMTELKTLLIHEFERWISFLYPYLAYASSSRKPMRLLWLESTSVEKKELAFQVYTLATRVNLLAEKDGVARGALFPVKWMEELLSWLCSSEEGETPSSRSTLKASSSSPAPPPPPPPGPFDTFQLVEVMEGPPVKHLVRENNTEGDVIPEELFNLLWSLFGGGPKYLIFGVFGMRHFIEERLQPSRISVSLIFHGFSANTQQHVLVNDVLQRATVSEVMRRGLLNLLQRTPPEKADEVSWFVALCSCEAINVYVTNPQEQLLFKEPNLDSRRTIGDILKQVLLIHPSEINNSTGDVHLLVCLRQQLDRSVFDAYGVCGLMNIGNTCYMNSALQCLLNMGGMRQALFSLPLSEYANPAITSELVNLMLSMSSGTSLVGDTRRLKMALGREERRFDTHEQQDAMEFIEVLLDRIHEEMNTVSGKSYRKRCDSDNAIPIPQLSEIFWKDFLFNNRSFIPGLFFHQSKTCLECLTCGEKTTVFESNPTIAAALLEREVKRVLEVVVLLSAVEWRRLWITVPCNDAGAVSVDAVVREITTQLLSLLGDASATAPVDGEDGFERMGPFTLNEHRVVLNFDYWRPILSEEGVLHAAVVPIGKTTPMRNDTVRRRVTMGKLKTAEIEDDEEEKDGAYLWYFLKARRAADSTQYRLCHVERFRPDAVQFEQSSISKHVLEQSEKLCKRFLKNISDEGDLSASPVLREDAQKGVNSGSCIRVLYQANKYDTLYPVRADDAADGWAGYGGLRISRYCMGESRILLEYDDTLMELNGNLREVASPATNTVGTSPSRRGRNSFSEFGDAVTIEDCLKHTFSPDTLTGDDAMYCNKCKASRDSRVERRLFLLPPCLIIYLKRFRMRMHEASKNNTLVAFDTVLDLAPYLDPESPAQNTKYKLVGVVFHRGVMNFGHYTASIFKESANQWIHCDDSSTTPLKDRPLARDAFILCYERDEGDMNEKNQTAGQKRRAI